MPTPLDVVMEQVAAYNARDLERFMATYAPTCQILMGTGDVFMDGEAAMRQVYGQMFAASPELYCNVPNTIVSGDYIILDEEFGNMNFPGMPSSGRGAVAYRVQDGKIVRVYFLM